MAQAVVYSINYINIFMKIKNNNSKRLLAALLTNTVKPAAISNKLANNTDNPQQVITLISQCEKLVAELKDSDKERTTELLKLLVKLKRILLRIFKKKTS